MSADLIFTHVHIIWAARIRRAVCIFVSQSSRNERIILICSWFSIVSFNVFILCHRKIITVYASRYYPRQVSCKYWRCQRKGWINRIGKHSTPSENKHKKKYSYDPHNLNPILTTTTLGRYSVMLGFFSFLVGIFSDHNNAPNSINTNTGLSSYIIQQMTGDIHV